MKRKRDLDDLIPGALGGVLFLTAAAILALARYMNRTYAVDFGALLYTVASPLKGTGGNTILAGLKACLPEMLLYLAGIGCSLFVLYQRRVSVLLTLRGGRQIELFRWVRRLLPLFGLAAVLLSLQQCDKVLGIRAWFEKRADQTTIYEDRYVDPQTVSIKGGKKNLIYIYVESLETTYASEDVGGAQPVNYIPELTSLALSEENVSFSDNAALGGFSVTAGATWTMGALFATNSGLPFAFPVENNSMSRHEIFAAGTTALGDILAREGYAQEFLCGSDGGFAGRQDFFEQHGNYEIFDYSTAVEKGYIDEGHRVWWGYEDYILYEIAKDEALRLASGGQPFNLTFLTVDQHAPAGYVCPKCGDRYDEQLANVLLCGDTLLMDFIDWCKEQDFFADTVIVITGDHPRMDTALVENTAYSDRQIYNCFLNAAKTPAQSTHGRIFTSQDIFPTVLSAMGFTIEGDRLGLGTDMFSAAPTLAEEMGLEQFQAELEKSSDYYLRTFS